MTSAATVESTIERAEARSGEPVGESSDVKCVCGHSLNDHEKPGLTHCHGCCRNAPVGECIHSFEEAE